MLEVVYQRQPSYAAVGREKKQDVQARWTRGPRSALAPTFPVPNDSPREGQLCRSRLVSISYTIHFCFLR